MATMAGETREQTEAPPSFVSFLIRRAATSLLTLILFTTGVFFLVETLIPYENPNQEGPPLPAWTRYISYMVDLARGDLGQSYSGLRVSSLIAASLPNTLLIFATGGILAYLLGSWMGRVAEWRLGRLGRGLTTTVGLVCYTLFPPLMVFILVNFGRDPLIWGRGVLGIPTDSLAIFRDSPIDEASVVSLGGRALLTALVVALIVRSFARRKGWRIVPILVLPAVLAGMVLAIAQLGIGPQAVDVFFFRSSREVEIGSGSPVLAIVAFVLLAFGEVMFLWRAGIADERLEDYVLTARGKGVPEQQIRDRHVARNVSLPILSRTVAALPFLLTGLIIIEYQVQVGSCALMSDTGQCVYWSGGLSTTLFTAIREIDIPVIVGVLLTMGAVLLVLRLVAEVAHAALDPRLRYRQ